MLKKTKRFFKNPVCLLMLAVSLAVITMGSVMAFNAFADNDENNRPPLPEGHDEDYTTAHADYFFFADTIPTFKNGEKLELRTYCPVVKEGSGTLTPVMDEYGNYTCGKLINSEGEEVDANDVKGDLTIKIPSAGTKKIWKYQQGEKYDDNGNFLKSYLKCVGSFDLSGVMGDLGYKEGDPLKIKITSDYDMVYFDLLDSKEPTTDEYTDNISDEDYQGVKWKSYYYYEIGDTPTHNGVESSDDKYPNWQNKVYYYYMYNFLALLGENYECTYSYDELQEYSRYELKVKEEGGFAYNYSKENGINFPINPSTYSVEYIFAIYDKNGHCIVPAKRRKHGSDRAYFSPYNFGLAFMKGHGSSCDCQFEDCRLSWVPYGDGAGGSAYINLPIAVTVKYDYSKYKDEGTISGGPEDGDICFRLQYDSTVQQVIANQVLNRYMPLPDVGKSPVLTTADGTEQHTILWKCTHNNDPANPLYSHFTFKPGETYMSGVIAGLELLDTNVYSYLPYFTFNPDTGYFEYEAKIEPLFDGEVRLLTYKDEMSKASRTEIYHVGDSGENPTATVKEIDAKLTWWREQGGRKVDSQFVIDCNKASTFKNWKQTTPTPTGDGNYSAGSMITLTEHETILEAQWERTKTGHYVTYDANGGSGEVPIDKNLYQKDSLVTVQYPYLLRMSGYHTTRWNTKPDGTGTNYDNGYANFHMPDYDVILYAIWDPNEFTLTYDKNTEETVKNLPDSVIWKYTEVDETLTLSSDKPTRTGYTFLGWSRDRNATTPTYTAGGDFTKVAKETLI